MPVVSYAVQTSDGQGDRRERIRHRREREVSGSAQGHLTPGSTAAARACSIVPFRNVYPIIAYWPCQTANAMEPIEHHASLIAANYTCALRKNVVPVEVIGVPMPIYLRSYKVKEP